MLFLCALSKTTSAEAASRAVSPCGWAEGENKTNVKEQAQRSVSQDRVGLSSGGREKDESEMDECRRSKVKQTRQAAGGKWEAAFGHQLSRCVKEGSKVRRAAKRRLVSRPGPQLTEIISTSRSTRVQTLKVLFLHA